MTSIPLIKPNVIGSLIRQARLEIGYSVREFAKASGVSKSHVARIELGQMQPTVETLVRLASTVGLPPALLVDDAIMAASGYHGSLRSNKALSLFIINQGWTATRVDDYARAFVSSCCSVADHMMRIASAQSFAERIHYPLECMREPYQQYALQVDRFFSAEDRLVYTHALMQDGYSYLKGCGLLDDAWLCDRVGAFIRTDTGALWLPFFDEASQRLINLDRKRRPTGTMAPGQ